MVCLRTGNTKAGDGTDQHALCCTFPSGRSVACNRHRHDRRWFLEDFPHGLEFLNRCLLLGSTLNCSCLFFVPCGKTNTQGNSRTRMCTASQKVCSTDIRCLCCLSFHPTNRNTDFVAEESKNAARIKQINPRRIQTKQTQNGNDRKRPKTPGTWRDGVCYRQSWQRVLSCNHRQRRRFGKT